MSIESYFVWILCIVYYLGIVTGWYSQHPSAEWYNPDALIHSVLFIILPLKISRWWFAKKEQLHD